MMAPGPVLDVEDPGQPSVVELLRPTLTENTKKITDEKTYVETPWLWRPLGNCPAFPLLNPDLDGSM